jgi:peptidoglycan/xylan/chitin deacetylase (PgdA/CDA1 family)
VALVPGPPALRVDRRGLAELCRARGRDAVRVLRRDPSLLPELQSGSWWAGGWRARLARRALLGVRVGTGRLPARLLADLAFWSGVREAASAAEWQRLAASSYVALCYHRLAGAAKPGQERMDVAPRTLERQLRLLRVLGWRRLSAEDVVAFHTRPDVTLPRRRYVLTADDGYPETVRELTGHAGLRPQVFAVTGSVGARASWLADEPLAGWDELRGLRAAGGEVGSHARRHVRLDTLPDAEIEAEVAGSLDDLRAMLPVDVPLMAYPHGRHDERVRAAARRAGYLAAYTTAQGRNGAGTDRWCLRRVEPKGWDTTLSFAWKVVTGESPPPRWERRLERRWAARRSAAGARGGG